MYMSQPRWSSRSGCMWPWLTGRRAHFRTEVLSCDDRSPKQSRGGVRPLLRFIFLGRASSFMELLLKRQTEEVLSLSGSSISGVLKALWDSAVWSELLGKRHCFKTVGLLALLPAVARSCLDLIFQNTGANRNYRLFDAVLDLLSTRVNTVTLRNHCSNHNSYSAALVTKKPCSTSCSSGRWFMNLSHRLSALLKSSIASVGVVRDSSPSPSRGHYF